MESPWQRGGALPVHAAPSPPWSKGMQERLHYPNRICIAKHGDDVWQTEKHAEYMESETCCLLTASILKANELAFSTKWIHWKRWFSFQVHLSEHCLHGTWCGGILFILLHLYYLLYYFDFPNSRYLPREEMHDRACLKYSSFGHVCFFSPPAAWIDLFPNAVPVWVLVCWANCLKSCTNCKLTLVLTSGLELLARKEMCWMTWNMNAMQTMGKP